MPFWVYVLECADQSYYVGHTDNLEKRVAGHESGELDGYTSSRLPVRVVFTQEFLTREEALAMELRVKGWSRLKKQALIHGDWTELSHLAKTGPPQGERACHSAIRCRTYVLEYLALW